METITRVIGPEEDGATVRHILRAVLHFSARAVSRLKSSETGILVNGERAFTNRVLRAGDILCAETGDQRGAMRDRMAGRGGILAGDWPLPVVWEDAHLLVVDKPAGMTAHASSFSPGDPTVAGALAWTRGADFVFHPVNRLDRGTTGLMVVSKSGYIHDRLRRALHTDGFRREYRAVCLGRPDPPAGTVDAPVGRDERSLVARMVRPDGRPAVTRYEVLASGTVVADNGESGGDTGKNTGKPGGERREQAVSLLKLLPETGRTHQLRVHMASLGCPLAGDWLYGTEDPSLIGRPALHSCALELVHPVTGELLRLTAPLPEDMAHIIRRMR